MEMPARRPFYRKGSSPPKKNPWGLDRGVLGGEVVSLSRKENEMAHARDYKAGKRSSTKGGGKLGKDEGCHSVPGFTGGDGHPGMLPARTGYTQSDQNKIGPSKKSTTISLHGKKG